jgi:Flp pilus assembly protein TadD
MIPRRGVVLALLATCAPAAGAAHAQGCDRVADSTVAAGWALYRADRMEAAAADFARARERCPRHVGARVGLGYTALRADDRAAARRWFRDVLAGDADDVDALVGLGIVAWRSGETAQAREALGRALALDSTRADARGLLERLPTEERPVARPPRRLPDTVEVAARTAGDRLEVWRDGRWAAFYVKGVNLGAALPGRYPSEFPGAEVYTAWLARIAAMGANTIRVYTIHPPAFYTALAAYDRAHADRPLRLMHGVWTELPPGHDFDDSAFVAGFEAEMRRVVDVVHGNADLAPRPGHASGSYTADVSPWVAGYIVGREWEPFAVAAYDRSHPDVSGWRGRYLEIAGGTAADVWLARVMDGMIAYETATYRTQRPLAYTSWPTLDPLHHVTETTLAEERAILRSLGEDVAEPPFDHDEDAVQLDPSLLRATAAFRAGVFASYHAYPYYPDFMVLDPGYNATRSPWGRSNYFGYLTALKARHPGMPVVIAEYGVPASLGDAHIQPQGWHHGGHGEAAMAAIDARLTREIAASGMAGGIVFAWIDEWFKRNWLVSAFELPAERNRLWLNRLDPEQLFGVTALEPEPVVPGASLADRLAAWSRVPVLGAVPRAFRVRAAADAAQLWLLFEPLAPGALDELYVGFDVVRPDLGSFRWPARRGPALPVGVEFVLQAHGRDVRLVADPAVNPFRFLPTTGLPGTQPLVPAIDDPPAGFFTARLTQVANPPYVPGKRSDGVFDPLRVITNRPRFSRDRLEYAGMGYDRGRLPEGEPPDGAWTRDAASGAVELRIPWMLLNVTDPSGRSVLYGSDRDGPRTVTVDGIGLVAAAPRSRAGWRATAARFTWPTWEEPRWRERARPVLDSLRAAFVGLGEDR